MYYVLCAATIERYGRQGLNIYIATQTPPQDPAQEEDPQHRLESDQ